MKTFFTRCLLLVGLCASALTLRAQEVTATIAPPLYRYRSLLVDVEKAGGELLVTISNRSSRSVLVQLEAELTQQNGSFKILTNPNVPQPTIPLGPNETRQLRGDELQTIFTASQFMLADGSPVESLYTTDPSARIPEGTYQLCFSLKTDNLNPQIPKGYSNCQAIEFSAFNPPLITTINNQPCQPGQDTLAVPAMPTANGFFPVTWTAPVLNAGSAALGSYAYTLQLVELLPNTDPNQVALALQTGNEPRAFTVNKPAIPASGSPLEQVVLQGADFIDSLKIGARYALFVRAESTDGQALPLPNFGYSQVCYFTYGTGRPVNSGGGDDLVDADLPTECSTGDCNAIPVPTGGTDVPALAANSVVRMGCFKITVTEATRAGEGFTGRGTVRIPFFNAKFKVQLNNLVVRRIGNALVATAGSATGLPDDVFSGPTAALFTNLKEAKNEVSAQLPASVVRAATADVEPLAELFDGIAQAGRLIRQASDASFETGLPIGYDSDVDGSTIRMGVFAMSFFPERATMNLALQTPLVPGINQQLYFGALNVCFGPAGISASNATFYLGGNLSAPVSGHTFTLIGAGSDRPADQVTYLTLDKAAVKEIGLKGEIAFAPGMLEADAANAPVKATFQTVVSRIDEVMLTLTMPRFHLTSLPDWSFGLDSVTLDLSTTRNPAGLVLPGDLNPATGGLPGTSATDQSIWTGIHARRVAIALPPDFKLSSSATARKEIAVTNLLIGFGDNSGLSLDASLTNVLSVSGSNGGKLAGFGFSIDALSLQIRQNEFRQFAMQGGLLFPLFSNPIAYTGTYGSTAADPTPRLTLGVGLTHDIALYAPSLSATFTVGSGSSVAFDAMTKLVTMNLNGAVSVQSGSEGVGLNGMAFNNFVYNGTTIDVSRFTISFASPQKWIGGEPTTSAPTVLADDANSAGGFPISFREFAPIFRGDLTNGFELGLGFTVSINLMGDAGFGVDAGFDLTGNVAFRNGDPVYSNPAIAFRKIRMEVDVSVVHVIAALEYIKSEEYGRAFRGCLSIEMKLPGLPIRGTIQGMFGSKGTNPETARYFYLDGRISGLNILIPQTPIAIDGFVGGLSRNMVSRTAGGSLSARFSGAASECNFDSLPPLVPSGTANFGLAFGVLVKEAASNGFAFNGMMAFGATIDPETMAPTEIGIGGDIQFLKAPDAPPSDQITMRATMDMTYSIVQETIDGNFAVYLKVFDKIQGNADLTTNLAGQMAMHFDFKPGGVWFVYLGNPWQNKGYGLDAMTATHAGVRFFIDNLGYIDGGAYFCMGNYGINGLPPLPTQLVYPDGFEDALAGNRPRLDPRASNGGIAFGAYLGGSFDANALYLKATLNFGFGFDVALIQYAAGVSCSGGEGGPFGINNFYATGQVYGFASGALTVDCPLGTYPLASGNFTMKADFGGPNPTWVDGTVTMDKPMFTGLVKAVAGVASGGLSGAVDTAFEIGTGIWNTVTGSDEEAKGLTDLIVDLVAPDGVDISFAKGTRCSQDELSSTASYDDRRGAVNPISYILPAVEPGKTYASLEPYGVISVLLNRPLDETWQVVKDGTVLTRRWRLTNPTLKRGTATIPLRKVKETATRIDYTPNYSDGTPTLSAADVVIFTATVVMQQQNAAGRFVAYDRYATGSSPRSTSIAQEQTVKIVPIDYTLAPGDIDYTYPVVGQKYYLKGHDSQGTAFVKLNRHLPEYSQPNTATQKLAFTTKTFVNGLPAGDGTFSYLNYQDNSAALLYNLPTLENNVDVRVEFWVTRTITTRAGSSPGLSSNPTVTGRSVTLTEAPIRVYTVAFHTSKYNTFAEKIASLSPTPFRHPSPDSNIMTTTLRTDEDWDAFEVGSNPFTWASHSGGRLPNFVSRAVIKPSTPWHSQTKAQLEGQYRRGEGNDPYPYYSTVWSDVSLADGQLSIEFDTNEWIWGAFLNPADCARPTAGDYVFTLLYNYPTLRYDGRLSNYESTPPASQPMGKLSGQIPPPIGQKAAQSGSTPPVSHPMLTQGVQKAVSVHYDGFEASQQRTQILTDAWLRRVVAASRRDRTVLPAKPAIR
ncbi:hypothetical protein [Fibrella forsythiae]|uniref:T9SS C-terminal target domain-containing protein n=1 Tax=Fibrella forsythiae TaxID=2817061 RepID=A0ABS3JM61_9BACT|nr:hypothetical protein [Fibrella forsythiae]MBO0950294.1 hypothetical protein [Fibrella forsythiae]